MTNLNQRVRWWLVVAVVGAIAAALILARLSRQATPPPALPSDNTRTGVTATSTQARRTASASPTTTYYTASTQNILTDLPCAPPCWYGIEPGMHMEREEVIHLLEAVPNVGGVWEPTWVLVAWFWERYLGERPGYNYIALTTDYHVGAIILTTDFELTVDQILRKYGLPQVTHAGVGPIPDNTYIVLFLHYPTRGLTNVEVRLDYSHPVLEPTSRVYGMTYVAPAESLDSWIASWQEDAYGMDLHLQPWPGYGPLDTEAYGLRTSQ
jgi:hypothetical protein